MVIEAEAQQVASVQTYQLQPVQGHRQKLVVVCTALKVSIRTSGRVSLGCPLVRQGGNFNIIYLHPHQEDAGPHHTHVVEIAVALLVPPGLMILYV